jgi:prephenate dehydrogenase
LWRRRSRPRRPRSGWSDTTRIAAGDATLWTQIFEQNRAAMADALRRFEHQLSSLADAITEGDAASLTHHLQEAQRRRDALGD